jgi:hypothetical protein
MFEKGPKLARMCKSEVFLPLLLAYYLWVVAAAAAA